MPEWEPKIWGERLLICKRNCVEVYLLNLTLKDGKSVCCSTHDHKMKYNQFYVLSGTVAVETEKETKVLSAGDRLTIEPHVKHRFTVLAPSKVIETTWVHTITEDIYRDDVGHVLADGEAALSAEKA